MLIYIAVFKMNHFIQSLFTSVIITSLAVTASYDAQDCYIQKYERIGDYTVGCLDSKLGSYFLNIHCHEYLSTNLPETIKIRSSSIAGIYFVNCTLSKTTILQNIIRSMDIVFGTIGFIDCDAPNRFNLQNLSAPFLFFDDRNISELPYDLFYDVLNIQLLRIAHTQLIRIAEDFFSDWATGLRTVILHNNALRKIARKDFASLVNLISLDLNQNEIEEIEEGAFDNLVHLEELTIDANRLHTLPSGIFQKMSSLTYIYFNLLAEYSHVKNLTLYQMKNLPSGAFKGATQLHEMHLSGHNLRTLPIGLFDDNKNLVRLQLNDNGLESLPVEIFRGLKSLWWLNLSNNRLTSLPSTIFIGLRSLEYLFASMNKLTYLDSQLIRTLKLARLIDFSYNQIEHFRYEMTFHKSSLKYDVDAMDVYVKYRTTLDLTNNHISKINLTALSSRIAKFDRFDLDTGKFDSVKLYLGNNPWHCDCESTDFIRYLKDCSHQQLQRYVMILANKKSNFGEGFTCSSPPEFKTRNFRKVRVEELYCPFQTSISGDDCNETCNCREYPEKQVLSVNCSHRNLTQLPATINNLRNWSIELNMSCNLLQRTPSLDHSSMINVTHLDLSSNKITEVSRSVFSRNLLELNLHNNSISRIDPKVIEYLARDNPLRRLTLHNNSWKCDCESHKMVYGSIRTKLQSYNFDEIFCYGSNRKLYEVAVIELCEDNTMLMFSVSLSIALFGIIVSSLAALYYKHQMQIKIWLYSRDLCLWFITDDELDRDKKYDAFISFAHKDEEFVEREIIAKLEDGPKPYKLCLHYRDWLPGEWIPLQISRSVADSRRTVIILTPNFLESVWGLVEFRTAHVQALKEGRARLIIILHEEIGNLDELDSDLKDYLNMNTYIKWGDPWFWQKLKYALPHRSRNSRVKKNHDTVHYRVNSDNNASTTDNIETISIS